MFSDNYVYIIASLPVLSLDVRNSADLDASEMISGIKERLSDKDRAAVDFLVGTGTEGKADAERYTLAKGHPSRFIREWLRFDLCLRNEKVRYINSRLGRDKDTDVVVVDDWSCDDEVVDEIRRTFLTEDLLAREYAIDSLKWVKVDELSMFHHLDFDVILAFTIKLGIVGRWLDLDESKGREMFARLVGEIRGTFKGVEYVNKQF